MHEVPGPAPWLDPERLEEQRRRLPESSYKRLFENVWTVAEDRLSSLEDLRHCVSLDGPQAYKGRYSYILALDVGVKSDATCAVVCHGSDGTVVLDRIMCWRGSRENHVDLAEVERWIVRAWKDYGHPRVRFDPWQALHLSQRLAAAGVRTEEFTFSSASVGKIAVTLYNLIRAHALALPDDPELIDELANVRLRESSPGVFRLDHDASRHDDRAVALALAAHAIVEEPPRSKPWVASFGPGRLDRFGQLLRADLLRPGRRIHRLGGPVTTRSGRLGVGLYI